MFGIAFEMIRPEDVETLGHSQLVRYDFSNGLPDRLQKFRIYSREPEPEYIRYPDANRAVLRVLLPSKIWEETFGTAILECIEPIESFGLDN
jgi:hypothetical protein